MRKLWLEPTVSIHPAVAEAIRGFDAVIIGPGSFFTSLMPPLLVRGVKEALAHVHGPIVLIANLLTEGRGMSGFTAADAARWVSDAIGRPVDVVIANDGRPSDDAVTLRGGTQGAARAGQSGSGHRAPSSGLLVHGNRPPRPPASGVCSLVGVESAAPAGFEPYRVRFRVAVFLVSRNALTAFLDRRLLLRALGRGLLRRGLPRCRLR